MLDEPSPDFWVSGGTALAALALIVAALVFEHVCRVSKGPEDPEDKDSHRSPSRT